MLGHTKLIFSSSFFQIFMEQAWEKSVQKDSYCMKGKTTHKSREYAVMVFQI